MERIPVTHAGSLIRPPELLSFLAAKDRGQPYDENAYAVALRDAALDALDEVGRQG
jgi:5-methyltetrahydropteroyltriglutamate--homocysteine methyltransferase